ncbi:MAG: TonB-dependent receptor [Prevotella sp.]|nr:TonB-dependent receptor [Prevotella sp.]
MLKQFIMWALVCSTAPFVCAQEQNLSDSTSCDTVEYSIPPRLLNEVVVTAATTISKNDRKVIRPPKETINASSNGIDLLRKLQLARISINPLTEEIAIVGGGSVVMCINGVESTSSQISAIRPQDIIRIEYHDNPGVRYTGAAAVIDYITLRHDTGGSVSLDAFGAMASGRYASIDHFAGQYNHGLSVWNVNVGFMGQQKDKWIRDYEESWHYPNATVIRQETGLPVKVGGSGLESLVNYNYMNQRGNMLNLRFGFDFNNVPNQEEGDRHSMLVTSDVETPVEITEHTEERSSCPTFGIYYLHKLSDTRNLSIDANGSYLKSKMLHLYSEDGFEESSRVNGYKYSIRFLAMYEQHTGSHVWNVGVSNSSSFVRNTYNLDDMVRIAVNQSQTAIVGEYSNRFGNWGVVCNVRATYNHLGQEGTDIDRFYALPSMNITYRPAAGWFLRYAASLDYSMPSAAEISAVEQPVQTSMIRRGNPGLKPFRTINQSFSATFEHRIVSVDARVEYRNEHCPIMESVVFENNRFVRTYFNQRSFQRLTTGVSVSLRPWQDHLSIAAEPVLTRYISHGIDYAHSHNIFRVGLSVDFNYGNWLAYANTMSGPANRMYGEEIIEEKDMNQIMVGYKRKKWSVHLGVFNAFMRNYWMETRNLSALAPYTSKAHSGRNSSYLAIKFNLSLDFGRKGRDVNVPKNDFDKESGILTGTK